MATNRLVSRVLHRAPNLKNPAHARVTAAKANRKQLLLALHFEAWMREKGVSKKNACLF